MDYLEYSDASKEDRGAMVFGRLKLTNNQIIFKNGKTGKVETISQSDIESLLWHRMAADYALRVMNKSGQMYRFGGFNESDYEKLNKFFSRNYSTDLKTRDNCLRGWNWGTANFDGSVLAFDIRKSERVFEVPLMNVSHCATAKNEVTLEFHHNDDAPNSLMEMRFHIPTIDGVDPVPSFLEQVLEKASIIQATGDAIATFKELQCLTPRGRYDIKIFPTFIQLHGKTFDYKIPITSVLRLFQLPHKDSRQVFFVLSLDPPIKQGQTRYHFLILLFNKDEELALELGISEREITSKYEGKVQKNMSGPVFEILAKLMRVMVQRKITVPDPAFCAAKDVPVITCSYRASAGLLYPLDRGFIYLHKPPIHIRFEEILSINFARSGGSTRSFDFEVETRSGLVHTFSSIEKEEYSKLFDFVSKKKLRVKNRGTEGEKTSRSRVDDDIVDSDLEDEPDAYLQRVREEGRIRAEGGDDSDESDESFNPDKESEGSVAEEFDSNASESSSEESGEDDTSSHKKKKKEKKEKHKKEKKKKVDKEKPRKAKKEKDENKPKRPQTAFFLWLNESREKLKKENPGLSVTEVAKKAGEVWKEKVKDKTKWEQKAADAKKKYEKEMEEYTASGGAEAFKAKSKSLPKKSEKSKSESKKSPTKSGSQYKSKEYISDSDSSSSSDDNKKKKKSPKGKGKGKDKKKKKEESDVEMKSASPSEASTPGSAADSD